MPVWLIPIAYTVASIIGAVILPRVEHALAPDLVLAVSTASAVTVLSAIASGMMALTGIVFSVAFVMLQFSAVTYSPRFATRFARDPVLFHALGIFFATFTYAIAAIAWADRAASGQVPAITSLAAVTLLFVSLIAFGILMRRLGDLQITSTLRYIGDQGRDVIRNVFGDGGRSGARRLAAAALPVPQAPATQVLRHAGAPRYVQRFDLHALVALARQSGGTIVLRVAVGDMLLDGATMLRVHGGTTPLPDGPLRRAVVLGDDRTFEQDPKYPIRLLVDVAIKALSPAINDPTTAVQALDQIDDLLRRLARQDLDDGCVPDADGIPRVAFPTPDWADYLSLAFDEIRMFGVTSVQVMRRLRSALVGLLDLLGESERAGAVQRYLHHVDAVIEASTLDEEDRRSARRRDPQGLGMARDDDTG